LTFTLRRAYAKDIHTHINTNTGPRPHGKGNARLYYHYLFIGIRTVIVGLLRD